MANAPKKEFINASSSDGINELKALTMFVTIITMTAQFVLLFKAFIILSNM